MTAARLEPEEPDPYGARAFFLRARRFAGDGRETGVSPEGRQVILHSAVIAACDAVLAIEGWRVTGSEGGHRLRLTKAQELLDGDEDLFERLDDARMNRNSASYRAAPVPSEDVDTTLATVERLVAQVESHLESRLPEHLSVRHD